MADTLKQVGASCPKCRASYCAEYAQMGQRARWTCHGCGASGELIGDVARTSTPPAAAPEKRPPPWARNLTKG